MDFRLEKKNPPLAKLITSFPLNFIDIKINFRKNWKVRNHWEFANDFMQDNRNNYHKIFMIARCPVMIFSIFSSFFIRNFNNLS